MNKQIISEEDNLQQQWYKDAEEQTLATLPTFINHLINDYSHDYGTICHAITASSIATAWAINKSDIGGITGFQASIIMWLFIKNWYKTGNKTGLKLVDYDDMLYPQYENHFDKTISKEIFENLQKIAKENLKDSPNAHPDVLKHWKSIAEGIVPFGYKVSEND